MRTGQRCQEKFDCGNIALVAPSLQALSCGAPCGKVGTGVPQKTTRKYEARASCALAELRTMLSMKPCEALKMAINI
jgi:hypothetical protein